MTPRRWWGVLAAAGAIFCFAMAGAYCTGCTPSQVAQADADVTKALAGEQLVCLAANFLPGTERATAIVACQIGEALTSAADAFLQKVEASRATASVRAAKAVVGAVATDAGGP